MFKLRSNNLFTSACVLGVLSAAVGCGPAESGDADADEVVGSSQSALNGGTLGWKPDSAQVVSAHQIFTAPPVGALPASVDLTAQMPPVGNQGGQGSCVGWAVSYAAKTYHERLEKGWDQNMALYRFSPAYVYNQINGGVDEGSYFSDALNLLVNKGADSIQYFPYDQANFTNQPDAASNTRAGRFRAQAWHTLALDVTVLKTNLQKGKPVIIGVQVFPDFDNLSATNPVYDSSAGTSRGGHALVLTGYDDAQQAFRLQNSWGTGWGLSGRGWLGYSFINDSKLGMAAYIMDDAVDAEPSVTNSLYMVQSGKLLRVDNDFGDWKSLSSSGGWTGTTSMAALSGSVYAIQNSKLLKVNPSDGTWQALGTGDWSGSTQMTTLGGSLYVQQSNALLKVNTTNGTWTRLGTSDWTGATSMTSLGSSLYVIQGSSLLKVDPTNGAFTYLSHGGWGGPTRLTAIGSSLYAIQNSQLLQVNPQTGAWTRIGTDTWSSATSMGALDGALYIVDSGNLFRVQTNGQRLALGTAPGWSGDTAMTSN